MLKLVAFRRHVITVDRMEAGVAKQACEPLVVDKLFHEIAPKYADEW